jgi:hypothetical protein
MSARARRSGGDDQVDLTQGAAQSGIEFVASGSGSAERRGSGGSQVVVKVDAAAVDSVADTVRTGDLLYELRCCLITIHVIVD